MSLYLDSSALVKRYVEEPGSAEVVGLMNADDGWFISRVGYVETARALAATAPRALARFEDEWPAFSVIELDPELASRAVELAREHGLRSLDAIHLASALLIPSAELTLATWDLRLRRAAGEDLGLSVVPR